MGRLSLAIACVCAGCGFHHGAAESPGDATGDAPDAPADALADAPGDAAAARSCWPQWLAATIRFNTPAQLANVNTTSLERDPFLTANDLTFFVSSDRTGSLGSTDVWTASRTSVTGTFDTPVIQTALSSTEGETKVSLTSDGLYAVLGSNRTGGQGGVDVWESRRSSTANAFPTPVQTHMGSVNTANDEHDPTISANGLHLYLAPTQPAPQHIVMASRANTNQNFGAPAAIAEITSTAGDADPSVSADELVIVFSSNRAASKAAVNIWYATRSSTSQAFGAPIEVPDVNSDSNDGDPHISHDGCHLYFANDAGDYNIYVADAQ